MPQFIPPIMPQNILRGIVPVASVWDVDPTNLQNCTDGDFATVTGTGSKVMGGAGTYGYLLFDLGSQKTILFALRAGLWSTAGIVASYIDSSDDDITYRLSDRTLAYFSAAAEKITDSSAQILTGRFFRLRMSVSAAATCYAKIYEVAAWELRV